MSSSSDTYASDAGRTSTTSAASSNLRKGASPRSRTPIAPGSAGLTFSLADVQIDKMADQPIYQQIYGSIRDSIRSGEYPVGKKLPSIRAMATELGVARNTVDAAYRQLVVEGYVKSRQGSGYIVQDVSAHQAQRSCEKPEAACTETADPCRGGCTYDFLYGDLCADGFPADDWKRLACEVLTCADVAKLTCYGERKGEYSLRSQIACFLGKTRGMDCRPEQVVITSGTQQSLATVLELFDSANDCVALEDPGFIGARVLVRNAGFPCQRIRTDQGSAAYLADIGKSGARIVYTTPSHQFPMGWHMGQRTRAELLQWARENDAYVIEDDYDCGYRFDVQPVPSLQSEDSWERVIYFGSFSKTLSPALRISYLVLPAHLLSRYEESFAGTRCTVGWIDQEILRRFMEQGLWEKHLRRMFNRYRKRYDLLMEVLDKTFDARVRVHSGQAGLFVLLEVKNGMDQEQLVAAARTCDVSVYDTRRYWIDQSHAPDNLVLLGFSAASETTIAEGVPRLAQAWFPER